MKLGEAVYVDTSALIPLAIPEVYSQWAEEALRNKDLLSSVIAQVELARVPKKSGGSDVEVAGLAKHLNLVGLNSEVVDLAAGIPGSLKTLDAIHVGTWLLLYSRGFECEFVTADRKLARAAESVGATVVHPFGSAL